MMCSLYLRNFFSGRNKFDSNSINEELIYCVEIRYCQRVLFCRYEAEFFEIVDLISAKAEKRRRVASTLSSRISASPLIFYNMFVLITVIGIFVMVFFIVEIVGNILIAIFENTP